jgi:hypothetical protein
MMGESNSDDVLERLFEEPETATIAATTTKSPRAEVRAKGFIEEFSEFILSNVPTSPEWAEDNAIGVLSAVVRPDLYVSTCIGDLPLNVWFLMIGPSGLAHKTTPWKYYVIPLLRKFHELTGKDLILPNSFSVEGLIEYMRNTGNTEGIILRDEFTTLIKESLGEKSYNVDMIEFLSQLYDGTTQKRYTRKAKLEEIRECYVVMLGCTTPYFYDVIEPQFFTQGVGNRILYEYYDGKPKLFTADEFFYDRQKDADREKRKEEFARGLAEMAKALQSKNYYLLPEQDAAQQIVEYKNRKAEEAYALYQKDPYDLKASYLTRAHEMVIKLSGLRALSKLWHSLSDPKAPKPPSSDIPIMPDDVEWAISKVERHIKNFERLLREWRSRPVTVRPRSYENEKEAFISVIASDPDGIKTQEEILRALGWYKDSKFYQLRNTLIDEGRIRELTEDEIKRLPREVKERHGIKGTGRLPKVFMVVGRAP